MSWAPPWPAPRTGRPPTLTVHRNRRTPRVTPDPSLAARSDRLFSISVALYSVAVVAFCAQLAFGRRPARTPELVAAGGGAPPPPMPAPSEVVAEPRQSRRWG